jgi:hypothetical protein
LKARGEDALIPLERVRVPRFTVPPKVAPSAFAIVSCFPLPLTAAVVVIVPEAPVSRLRVPPAPPIVRFDRLTFSPAAPPVAMLPWKVFVPVVVAVSPPVKVKVSAFASPRLTPPVLLKLTAFVIEVPEPVMDTA